MTHYMQRSRDTRTLVNQILIKIEVENEASLMILSVTLLSSKSSSLKCQNYISKT